MMRRVELQDLLAAGTVSDRSRSEVLQGAGAVAAGGAKSLPAAGGGGGGQAGGSSSVADLSSLLQGPAQNVTDQISALTSQITALSSAQQAQVGAIQDNTQAVTQNTTTKSGGSSVGSTIGSVASSVLGGGLSPIIGGLLSLFGGGGSQTLAAPAPFILPTPVQYNAGLTGASPGQAAPVSSSASGQPRPQASAPAPQITVQVNAMDSQSFLDHSDDIANAVRQALLSSNSLSDVIADL
jgi:TolA-binding protein